MQITHLTCEYLATPLGIETPAPRLSWQLASSRRNVIQRAYQVLVAGSPAQLAAGVGDLWDSGRVASAQSVHVPYAGTPLRSGQRCYWLVRVWDGDTVAESAPTWWEMGLLEETDWAAQWICAPRIYFPEGDGVSDWRTPLRPAPYFRKEVTLAQPVVSARAYICGLGYYELYLNGQRVGDHVLDPTVTSYDKRAHYVAHDVTALLQSGANTLGVVLGNGQYNCHTADVWHLDKAPWRDDPKLLLQIHATLADGSSVLIPSDATWRVTTGPILFDGLRNGETYDARREIAGWAQPGFDDAGWQQAARTAAPGGLLCAQLVPIKVMRTLAPVAVSEVAPGVFVFDMGENIAGWAQLTVSGPAGTEITLRYAERVSESGDIDQALLKWGTLDEHFQMDRYILHGAGVETWEPRFTYHGFRYVQVTGFPGVPTLEALRGRVVHSDFSPAGEFTCSNETLNAIQRCTLRSYVSNYVGIPTDCPHREKHGWTGDAQIACETGLMNFSAAPAYGKWLYDIGDVQRLSGQLPGIVPTGGWGYNWGNGPAWDSALSHIPWYMYLYCGDTRALAEVYPGVQRYVRYLEQRAVGDLVDFGLGDWVPVDWGNMAPVVITSTGYYYANCRIAAQAAALQGFSEDAARYTAQAERVRQAFLRKFAEPISQGEQTVLACALYQGLIPAEDRGAVTERLVAAIAANGGKLTGGMLGAKYLLRALAEQQRADVAYALAAQTEFPSWGYMLEHGATTLWENWHGDISLNHILFGDISAWMYATLAGIRPDPDCAGFKHSIINPQPVGDLSWARGEHASPYGAIRSAWTIADGRFTLNVTIPANTTATVYLPTEHAEAVREASMPELAPLPGRTAAFAIGSGDYQFTLPVAELGDYLHRTDMVRG